jgi:hypothetical protein
MEIKIILEPDINPKNLRIVRGIREAIEIIRARHRPV